MPHKHKIPPNLRNGINQRTGRVISGRADDRTGHLYSPPDSRTVTRTGQTIENYHLFYPPTSILNIQTVRSRHFDVTGKGIIWLAALVLRFELWRMFHR